MQPVATYIHTFRWMHTKYVLYTHPFFSVHADLIHSWNVLCVKLLSRSLQFTFCQMTKHMWRCKILNFNTFRPGNVEKTRFKKSVSFFLLHTQSGGRMLSWLEMPAFQHGSVVEVVGSDPTAVYCLLPGLKAAGVLHPAYKLRANWRRRWQPRP